MVAIGLMAFGTRRARLLAAPSIFSLSGLSLLTQLSRGCAADLGTGGPTLQQSCLMVDGLDFYVLSPRGTTCVDCDDWLGCWSTLSGESMRPRFAVTASSPVLLETGPSPQVEAWTVALEMVDLRILRFAIQSRRSLVRHSSKTKAPNHS